LSEARLFYIRTANKKSEDDEQQINVYLSDVLHSKSSRPLRKSSSSADFLTSREHLRKQWNAETVENCFL
jgi:hypothetical protein